MAKAASLPAITESDDAAERLVDPKVATRKIMRFANLHPTNVGQKVEIIVEHFRANVAHLLDGHAKAMVVTDSRQAAVRYKVETDKYLAQKRYGYQTIVAFSGSISDEDYGLTDATEASMNPGLGSDLAKEFRRPEYRVMLVADKFQTGFDQPLLCAMYVDKRLPDVHAVQTLSRLNRTYRAPSGELKDRTFVLDFVNDPSEIREAFLTYYLEAHVETATDPEPGPPPRDKAGPGADIYARRRREVRRGLVGPQPVACGASSRGSACTGRVREPVERCDGAA